jgi:hypothetical protein
MAILPTPNYETVQLIYDAYEKDADSGNRPHLGASLIGHACERYLWYTFRWIDSKQFSGRILRLFETGQLEEARIVANLRRIGVTVHDVTPEGAQWRVEDFGGHFGGSLDGACVGLPEAPKTWHVLEFKTHNDKSFTDLTKNGVEKAKPMHFAQMQMYMGYTGMDRAMYIAVNKNNDAIHSERIQFNEDEFEKYKARAERVIRANEPPLKCSNDPSWYVCKMCDFAEHCHGDVAPAVNCRTCAHSTPEMDGVARWSCAIKTDDNTISLDTQRTGCAKHRYIPILLDNFAKEDYIIDGKVAYQTEAGHFINGDEGSKELSSKEIRACTSKDMLADAYKFKTELHDAGADSQVVS